MDLRPRTIVEIFDGAFRLYARNIGLLLAIVAVAYVPVILASAYLITGFFGPEFKSMGIDVQSGQVLDKDDSDGGLPQGAPGTRAQDPARLATLFLKLAGVWFGFLLLQLFAVTLSTGAITYTVSELYLGATPSFGRSYGFILKMFFPYLWTNLLFGLVVGLGFVCCIIPGLFFLVWFLFAPMITVLERTYGTSALARSSSLTSGSRWRVFGFWLLVIVFTLVLRTVVEQSVGLAFRAAVKDPSTWLVVSTTLPQVVELLIFPIFSAAWVLLYYDLRIRKEGFDLAMLARTLNRPAPGTA